MPSLRFNVTLFFPDDRKEYTDQYGRPHKIEDYKHWEQWIHQALHKSPDNALHRCGRATVSVIQNPELEPVWVTCHKCGERTRVILKGLADVGLTIGRYPKGSSASGYIVPDWVDSDLMELHNNEYEYVCDRCGSKIFDTIDQIEDYVKAQEKPEHETP